MPRCSATTKKGNRCQNIASEGSRYCTTHSGSFDWKRSAAMVGGALLGNAIAPGVGGVVAGAVGGNLIDRQILKEGEVKRVFVSFDFDKDKFLKDAVIGQSRNSDSPFEIVNWSLNEPAPQRQWKDEARARIKRSDVVLVMVGTHTHKAPGVLAEVAIAREESIPIVQVQGYEDKECPSVPNAGRYYRWTWDNLKTLLK